MNRTKEAIKDFVSRSGHHDTEVHESIQPGVTHENVKRTHHEELNPTVDREVHHDHYHHTVQPVKDKQVLPEQHQHQTRDVEHREFDERNHDRTKQAVAAQSAKFKDERVVQPTVHTQSQAPVIHGEHHHHHIHETVQPVIERETIQPTVVHTTVPIHETHHTAAKHHAATTLPTITMDEFKARGGMTGHGSKGKPEEHHYRYEGQPTEAGKIQSNAQGGPIDNAHGSGHGEAAHRHGVAGAVAGAVTGGRRRIHHKRTASNSSYSSSDYDDDSTHSAKAYSNGTARTSVSGAGSATAAGTGMHAVPRSEQVAVSAGNNSVPQKKPSLLNKINPLTDADGDGKKGFMH